MEGNKPRWEVRYEQYLAEEPISEKIKKIEKNTKDKIKKRQAKIENLEAQKVTGKFKTKEEYEAAVEAHKKQIEDVKKEKADLEASLENDEKLKDYRNYEKNKDKIKNIYEYRNTLMKKLENLPIDTKKELEEKKQEQQARVSRIGQYQIEIAELKEKLNEKTLTEEQKQPILLELQNKINASNQKRAEYNKAREDIETLEKKGKNFSENTIMKKEEYQRKIAKCNLIAANLLKGKEIDDITIKVEEDEKRFISKDGKLGKKIENVRKQEKENTINNAEPEKENGMTEISSFEQKHPRLAKIGKFFRNIFNKKDKTNISKDNILENDNENELLKEIAEKGAEKTFREKYAVKKQVAANEYAQKYGGRYENQDGATVQQGNQEKGR